jgi:hypothetical protein
MKVSFSQLLATLTIILTISGASTVFAQEGDPLNETPELSASYPDPSLREEKPLLYEPDGKTTLQTEQMSHRLLLKQKERILNQLKLPTVKQKRTHSPSTSFTTSYRSLKFLIS